MRYLFFFILILGALGCASQNYHYAALGPGEKPGDPHHGDAYYSVPAKSSIRVRSLGLVDLRAKGDATRIPALHIRMALSNSDGTSPWQFEPSAQMALFPDLAQVPPLYTTSNSQDGKVEVKPGELRIVDLYFPVPKNGKVLMDLPEFDLKWTVQTGDETRHETTTFERLREETGGYPAYDYYGGGYPPMWESYWGAPVYTPSIRVRQ